jgi:hypothetical protein
MVVVTKSEADRRRREEREERTRVLVRVLIGAVVIGLVVFLVVRFRSKQNEPEEPKEEEEEEQKPDNQGQAVVPDVVIQEPEPRKLPNYAKALLGGVAGAATLYAGSRYYNDKPIIPFRQPRRRVVPQLTQSLKTRRVCGDGNCFYRSISDIINGDEKGWKGVKDSLYDFFLSGESQVVENIKAIGGPEGRKLLRDMELDLKTPGRFAGDQVIALTEEFYEKRIIVHRDNTGEPVYSGSDVYDGKLPWQIVILNENHFEPLDEEFNFQLTRK